MTIADDFRQVPTEPERIKFTVDDVGHRGYRDNSGRFTLEQCNLAKASTADNLVELEGGAYPEGTDLCLHCWPRGE